MTDEQHLRELLIECTRVLPGVIELALKAGHEDLTDIIEAKEAFKAAADFLLSSDTAAVEHVGTLWSYLASERKKLP